MHADQHGLRRGHIAHDQGQMRHAVQFRTVDGETEIAVLCGQRRLGLLFDEPFRFPPVRHDVRDGADLQSVFLLEFQQIIQTRHAPVVLRDLADHARGRQSRKTRQIRGAFRVASPLQYASGPRRYGEDVTRDPEVRPFRRGIQKTADRVGPVEGADSRGPARQRVQTLRECRLEVIGGGRPQDPELLRPGLRDRRAHQSPRVGDHEIDEFRRHFFRRAHQVPLVLPLFVVRQNDQFPRPDVFQHALDRIKFRFHVISSASTDVFPGHPPRMTEFSMIQ